MARIRYMNFMTSSELPLIRNKNKTDQFSYFMYNCAMLCHMQNCSFVTSPLPQEELPVISVVNG